MVNGYTQYNKNMKQFYCLVILLLTFSCFSQKSSIINGTIISVDNKPIPGVTVLIIHETKLETIKAALSDGDGKFESEINTVNSFRLWIKHLGYEDYLSEVYTISGESIVIPKITLKATNQVLNEVTITKQKPFIVQKIDRIVVTPDALITNAGSTALEVLEKAPAVNVDMNGNISIRGKSGVQVFIDDKPSYLSAADLASYLRSIPSSSIDVIEIMVNPPARYDAAGNAGIINIKLKKNRAKGFNGGINLSYGQGRYMRTNNSINFNYRIQNWNFFSNLGINNNQSYQDLTIKREYFTPTGERSSVFTQNSFITPNSSGNSLRLGTDFYATKKTTLGIVLSGFINPSTRNTFNNATIQDQNLQVVSLVEASNPMKTQFNNGSVNLNLSHKVNDKGEELAVNVDNIVYDSKVSQSLQNNTYTPERVLTGSSLLDSRLPSDVKIMAAKVDYLGVKVKGATVDFGTKTSYVKTNNLADFSDVNNGVSTPNYEFSNDFTYRERIHAVYANCSKEYKKVSLEIGLRLEQTNVKGYQAGNPIVADSTFNIKYTNLFPTFYFQYRVDSLQNNVIGLSLGRRIDRPNYKDLNPFTYPMDRFTFYGGNPFLKPTFSYNADLSHTYKQYLTTTLSYSYIDNIINETNEQRGNIYYSRPGNFDKQISYGISVNGTFVLKKWWTLQCYVAGMNNRFESRVYSQNLDDSKWYWVFMPTNQFVINKKWTAELSGQYQTKLLSGQFLISPIGSVRAGIATRILKDKGSLKLNVSDVFYTNQIQGQIRNIQNATASWYSFLDSRVVTISFSYRFSKGENLRVRQSGSSETEQKRVKA